MTGCLEIPNFAAFKLQFHGIIECSELKGTKKKNESNSRPHIGQLQSSHHMSEGVFQTLLV